MRGEESRLNVCSKLRKVKKANGEIVSLNKVSTGEWTGCEISC